MRPDAAQLYDVCDGTWPALLRSSHGPWTIRHGDGGGKRVSAATLHGQLGQIEMAEDAMRKLGQPLLFQIRDGDDALDDALASRGYDIVDPVTLYVAPIETLTDQPIPPVTAFTIWEPLAIMTEIWATGGIGPARLRVMDRAPLKTGIFGRVRDKPAGAAFAAMHNGVCMVHAVEVAPQHRRNGAAEWMMRKAAFWALAHDARWISALCVTENTAANALYRKLGFAQVGRYHYRQKGQGGPDD